MKAERLGLKVFRAEYEKMRLRLRTGTGKVEFPEGTYRLRLLGLRCKTCVARAEAKRASPAPKTRKKKAA